jgi:hypothetical protein
VRSLRVAVALSALACLLATPARPATLGEIVAASDVIVLATPAGEKDSSDWSSLAIEHTFRASAPSPPSVRRLSRTGRARKLGPGAYFLRHDPLGDTGDHVLVDPEFGFISIGTGGASRQALTAAIELELSPPDDPIRLLAAYLRQLTQGDILAASAARTLARDEEGAARFPPQVRRGLVELLESRGVGGEAEAELVQLVALVDEARVGAVLIDLVAGGASTTTLSAVEQVLPRLADADLASTLLHGLGRTNEQARPDLVRLIGAAGATSLLPELLPFLRASNRRLRLSAIAACRGLGSTEALPALRAALETADEETAELLEQAIAELEPASEPVLPVPAEEG